MKKWTYYMMIVFVMVMLLPGWSVYGQVPSKKSLPSVPITYDGDTDATIIRRAQWIEGAKEERDLVYWSSKSPEMGRKIIAEFNKIYPFIKGTFVGAAGEGVGPKVEIETVRGKFSVDVIEGANESYPRWREKKIIAKFTDIIPGIKKLPKRAYSKYGDWAIPAANVNTPQYNTTLVSKAEAPKSYEDLLDPKWKGNLGMADDLKVWVSFALEEGGWGVEKTLQYLNKLREQKLIWTKGHSAGHALLKAGEFKVLSGGYVYHAMNSQKKGAPVEFSRVNTVVVSGGTIGQINAAPHPNAAKLFLEWLLSPQGLIIYEDITGQGAVYPGASTRQAKLVAGLNYIYRTEEGTIKSIELGLEEKLAHALGLPK